MKKRFVCTALVLFVFCFTTYADGREYGGNTYQGSTEDKLCTTPHDLSSNDGNPDFSLSCSSDLDDRDAFQAMNGKNREGFEFHTRHEKNPWWKITFKKGPVLLKSFWIKNRSMRNRGYWCTIPAVFVPELVLSGSTNGITWIVLKKFSLSTESDDVTVVMLSHDKYYAYYRISPQRRKKKENYLVIGEIEFQYYDYDTNKPPEKSGKSKQRTQKSTVQEDDY